MMRWLPLWLRMLPVLVAFARSRARRNDPPLATSVVLLAVGHVPGPAAAAAAAASSSRAHDCDIALWLLPSVVRSSVLRPIGGQIIASLPKALREGQKQMSAERYVEEALRRPSAHAAGRGLGMVVLIFDEIDQLISKGNQVSTCVARVCARARR